MTASVYQLNAETRAALDLRLFLEKEFANDADKGTLILDLIEGQTGIHELIGILAREAKLYEQMAEAVRRIREDNTTRIVRLEHKADKLRNAIARAMDELELPRVGGDMRVPDLLVTCRKGTTDPHVENLDQLPERFKKIKTEVKADFRAIKDFITDTGQSLPGVVMRNGPPVLAIRTK